MVHSRGCTLFRVSAGLALGSCLAALAPSAAAQTRKLSGQLPRTPGKVLEHWTTRDGAWCVYLANPEVEAPALYSVSLSRPRQPRELSRGIHGPIAPQGVRVPAAGTNVVFSAGGVLHAVPIDGSASPVRIGGTSVTGVAVGDNDHAVSSDGTQVVFWTRAQGGPFELRSASLAAPGTTVLLSTGAGKIATFALTPDGTRVVYTADQDAPGVYALFAVALDGSGPAQKLSGTLASGGYVGQFELAPDGARVVYRADAEQNDVVELFSVPLDGSASPVKLSGTLVAGGDVEDFFAVLPSGLAVYRADALVDRTHELFSVPLDGSAPAVRLNAPLPNFASVSFFRATPDGTKVVYLVYEFGADRRVLYVAPADGSAPAVQLDGPPAWLQYESGLRMSADGKLVVYLAQDVSGIVDLYAVALAAGARAVRVSDSAATEGSFEISPDGRRVAYRATFDRFEPSEFRSAPADGSAPSVFLCSIRPFASSFGFSISPDSRTVLYRADEERGHAVELFRRALDGHDAPLPLSMPLVPGPVVGDAGVVGIGSGHAVYHAWSRESPVPHELWTVSLRGAPAPRRIVIDPQPSQLWAELDPSGRWILIWVQQEGDYNELWTAPVDGSRPAVRLSPPAIDPPAYWNSVHWHSVDARGDRLAFATTMGVFAASLDGSTRARRLSRVVDASDIAIDPAGTRVVYKIWNSNRDTTELFVAAWDGSTAPLRLIPSHGRGRYLYEARVSPRGDRVVYTADQDTAGVNELYSVPIDGSGSPVKLSGTLARRGSAAWASLMSSERVVYLADARADGLWGIYSAPLDGSAPPVALYLRLSQSTFFELALTADEQRVTFLADPEGDGSDELFSVPITGGRPVRLSGPLVAGGDVQMSYQLDARGKRIVYLADQDADEVYELFSVRADGSGAPVRLCGVARPDANGLPGFALSPDGNLVVFAADTRVDDVVELFAVPTLGGASPRPLHRPLGARADVRTHFAFTRDSRHVVYTADPFNDDIFELFESVLPR